MATTLRTPPLQSDQTERVLLKGIRWSTYEALLEDLVESHIRLTYDRGSLEIMTLSGTHEFSKKDLARMIEALTEFEHPDPQRRLTDMPEPVERERA